MPNVLSTRALKL